MFVAEPELSVDFFAGVLGWTVIAESGGSFSGWVGDRLAAQVVVGDAGWRVVFGGDGPRGLELNSSVDSGRVLHGPWAPPPRHGEPCWVELGSADSGYWARELGWESAPGGVFTSSRGGESRVVAGSEPDGAAAEGWGVFFAVDDVESALVRVSRLDGEVISAPSVSSRGVVASISGPRGGRCVLLERPSGWGGVLVGA